MKTKTVNNKKLVINKVLTRFHFLNKKTLKFKGNGADGRV